MQEQIITHKHNKTIFVTELRQFVLPAAIHIDTIRKAIQREADTFTLDLYGLNGRVWRWEHATEQDAREHLVSKMIEWLKQYGVYIGFGVYFEVKE